MIESKFTKIIWHVRHEIYFHEHKTIYFTQCPLSIYVNTTFDFFGNSHLEKGKSLVIESSHFCVE